MLSFRLLYWNLWNKMIWIWPTSTDYYPFHDSASCFLPELTFFDWLPLLLPNLTFQDWWFKFVVPRAPNKLVSVPCLFPPSIGSLKLQCVLWICTSATTAVVVVLIENIVDSVDHFLHVSQHVVQSYVKRLISSRTQSPIGIFTVKWLLSLQK